MSDYNFTKFTSRGSKLGNYKISINKSRSLGLLSGFYSKENIKNYKRAVLFFDKKRKAIALSFTNDDKAIGAFKISHSKNSNNTGSIAAHSFFTGNEITQDIYTGQRVPTKIRDENFGTLFVIDLQK